MLLILILILILIFSGSDDFSHDQEHEQDCGGTRWNLLVAEPDRAR
jgi:hypothetical protein